MEEKEAICARLELMMANQPACLSLGRLTAFVLKSFAQAKQYIPNTVDTDILDSAVSFLFTRQTQDSGLFYELGRVIHDDMQVSVFKSGMCMINRELLCFIKVLGVGGVVVWSLPSQRMGW